jgi:hypothetical protein
MSSNVALRTENIQTTISQLNADFAGRTDMPAYDESRLIHIHRRNRAYVWNKDMQEGCLDSILKGYYIPPIICCSVIRDGRERREIMEGGNRVTTFRRILNEDIRDLSAEERRTVEAHPITLVVMRNLTPLQQRQMFRRLNKNIRVSDGQLFAMSIDDSPLVAEAHALLNDNDHPLRESMTTLFFDSRLGDTAAQNNLSNAVALVSGAAHGVHYITRSFNMQEQKVEDQTPISRAVVVDRLGKVFEIFRMANRSTPLTDKRRMKGQFNVGKWLGAILYDLLMNPDDTRQIQDKWTTYILRARQAGYADAEAASTIAGAQNLTPNLLKKISTKVEIYINHNRIATEVEMRTIVHPRDQPEEEVDDDSDAAYEENDADI